MKQLGFALVLALAVVGCSKKDNGGAAAGSGSAATGSAMASGSGSAMAAGSGSAMAGSGAGSGSAVAMAGSGDGSGSAAWDWDKLTHDEQMDYMKKHVVPTMKPLFQKFDAKHYKDFGCKTCHGKDPKKSKFKMPTPDLPKLDFAALKAGKQKPKVAEWMGKVVKPEMAKILEQPEWTPEHQDGFGCGNCHTEKKK